jgi:hypothetical protein
LITRIIFGDEYRSLSFSLCVITTVFNIMYVFCYVIVYSLFCIVIFMYIICQFVLCVLV